MPISQTGARMETEADEYLNEWREIPLTSVADIRFSSVNKVSQPGEEPVRLCNYTDVYNNDYVTADMDFMRATATRSEIERFGLQVGDVIITKDSETPDDIGIPTVVDTTAPDLVCGYHLALLRLHQDEVDPTFLAKQLAHHRIARYFGQQANGTTRYGLSTAAISNAPLHLPRPESQRTASALMRMVDAQIAQIEAVIAKLKKVRAGMLHDLLSYGLDEHGQLRDPIAHPEQFQDSPLGLIPRDWEPKSLGILCSHIGSGVTPRGGQDVYTKEGILFIRSQNVTFDGLKLDDIAYIPRHIHIGMLRSEVFVHDVLFNITGASIGRCCAMPGDMGIANVNQHVCILRIPDATEFDAVFLSTVLSSTIGQKQLEALNTCGNRQGLNYQQLGSFIVPWPGREERGLIAGQVKKTAAGLSAEINELKKLRSLKVGLQDDLLTGRVRVTETIMEGAENA